MGPRATENTQTGPDFRAGSSNRCPYSSSIFLGPEVPSILENKHMLYNK